MPYLRIGLALAMVAVLGWSLPHAMAQEEDGRRNAKKAVNKDKLRKMGGPAGAEGGSKAPGANVDEGAGLGASGALDESDDDNPRERRKTQKKQGINKDKLRAMGGPAGAEGGSKAPGANVDEGAGLGASGALDESDDDKPRERRKTQKKQGINKDKLRAMGGPAGTAGGSTAPKPAGASGAAEGAGEALDAGDESETRRRPASRAANKILWRPTLAKAISDATAANKPILVDFYAEWCGPCKQLDKTTFTDARVIKFVNENFIPVKIDVDKHQSIAKEYGVSAMPTTMILRPDGKMADKFIGYLDADSYLAETQKRLKSAGSAVLARATPPQKQLEEGEKARSSGKMSLALGFLGQLINGANKDSPEAKAAAEKVSAIESEAAAKLEKMREAARKNDYAALSKLSAEIQDVYAGTRAAAEAKELHQTLANSTEAKAAIRRAAGIQMLDQAVADYRAQRYSMALERFKKVEAEFADVDFVAKEARWMLERMEKNPMIMRKARDEVAEAQCKIWLQRARNWASNDRAKKASEIYQKVIDTFPGTSFAEMAQHEMSRL